MAVSASAMQTRLPRETRPGRVVAIPERAVEIAPDVFDLGLSVDRVTGRKVQGLAFIHRRDNNARSSRGGTSRVPKAPACYALLASGAKWKSVEPWIMNTDNTSGLSGGDVFGIMTNGIYKWEDAADGGVGNGSIINILGDGSLAVSALEADMISPDGQNEVYFADIEDPGVIGVTIVWGYFSGPSKWRELLEWDMVFDDTDFDWSAEAGGVSGKMDFENIATHELGHAVGMGDVYESACQDVTMYGYAGEGEINKRDLELQDVKGVSSLY